MYRDIVVLLPMFVCLLWAIALYSVFRRGDFARLSLAIFMTISFILYFAHAVYFYGYLDLYAVIDPAYTFASLSVYPLFYIYVRMLSRDITLEPAVIFTLFPALFFGLALALIYSMLEPIELDAIVNQYLYREKVQYDYSMLGKIAIGTIKAGRIVFILQIAPFVYYCRRDISAYNRLIGEYYSSVEGRDLTWVRKITTVLFLTAIFSMVAGIIGRSFFMQEDYLIFIPSLVFSSMLFLIGFLGFRQSFTIRDYRKELSVKENHRETGLNLQDKTREKIKNDLVVLFEEKEYYRKTDLRITDVSAVLGTNRSYISSIVNVDYDSTFSDFVNKYRVEYAKKLLLDKRNHVLDYVAEESGFASVNSLLRAFKKETSLTPGQFRTSGKNKVED
jgi:AraC-like DNA-binding protein